MIVKKIERDVKMNFSADFENLAIFVKKTKTKKQQLYNL